MNIQASPKDDDVWSKLVDGQFDADTLRSLTTLCDSDPALWKRCALVLLEEQVLEQELKALHTLPPTQPPLLSKSALVPSKEPTTTALNPPSASARPAGNWLNSVALAASVMLAFMIGWQSSQRWGRSPSTGPAANTVVQSSGTSLGTSSSRAGAELVAGASSSPPATTRQATVPTLVNLPDEQIETLNAENLANVFRAQPSPEIQQRTNELRRQGYDVETKTGVVPVILKDGRPAIVPFEQIRVEPRRYKNAF